MINGLHSNVNTVSSLARQQRRIQQEKKWRREKSIIVVERLLRARNRELVFARTHESKRAIGFLARFSLSLTTTVFASPPPQPRRHQAAKSRRLRKKHPKESSVCSKNSQKNVTMQHDWMN